jgi:hypothetical protein
MGQELGSRFVKITEVHLKSEFNNSTIQASQSLLNYLFQTDAIALIHS